VAQVHALPRSGISPRVCELVCAVLLVLLTLAPNSLLNSDGDPAHHIAVGRVMLTTGALPMVDVFSHAHYGQFFVNWEWFPQLGMALADRLLGLNGVALLAAALIAGTLYGLARVLLAAGLHPLPALVLLLLTTVASEIHWLARPYLWSWALFPVLLGVLEGVRTGRLRPRALLWVVPLMALWTNLHAAFVSGLACLAAYAVGATLDQLRARWPTGWPLLVGPPSPVPPAAWWLALAGGLAATLINPYGLALHAHIGEYLQGSFTTRLIVEYQPPDLTRPITWGFLVLVALMGVVVLLTWRRMPAAHLALLGAWTVLSFQTARHILEYSVIAAALLAPHLAWLLNGGASALRAGFWQRYRTPPTARLGLPWILGATALGLLVLVALGGRIGPVQVLNARWTEPPFPVQALNTLQAEGRFPAGRMFNYMPWGGYLLYALHPGHQIFIDAQQDMYGDALSADYLTMELAAPGWDTLIDRYGVDWVIEVPAAPLVAALRAQPQQWQLWHEDPTAVVFTRR
jgi:hypothetical protein